MSDMVELTHISLFTGIGGIDLAAEAAGFTTILMVEKDKYCQKVIKKHWPDVPILEDIFNVTKENVENARRQYGERQLLQREYEEENNKGATTSHQRPDSPSRVDISAAARELPPITLTTGGFPCQPVSHAGQRRGKEDDRYLWPEMLRVIKEVRPRWVVAENVAGLITMGLADCLSDLEREGYITETFLIPACAVNAPHRRDRIFIVAYSKRDNAGQSIVEPRDNKRQNPEANRVGLRAEPGRRSETVANTERGRCESGREGKAERDFQFINSKSEAVANGESNHWAGEPDVGRVAHGIPSRVDRLRALGNAVVPQQIYPILKAIADIERGRA